MTIPELIQLFQAFSGGGKKAKDPNAQTGGQPAAGGQPQPGGDVNAKLDQMLNLLQGALAPQTAPQGVPQ